MKNDGKELELLVHLIERSISPNAEVEHDVDMPILNSKIGATTQCDIVIRAGTHPRQTITLIEVQDRGSKVKPNEFRGWKQKLEDVGAQHLICVSKQHFPESIKEKASMSGGAIMLITLQESLPDTLPLDFVRFHYNFRNFDILALNYAQVSVSKSEVISLDVRDKVQSNPSVNVNERCWSVDGQHLVSLFILCRDYFTPPKGQDSGTGTINFDQKEDPPLYYFVDGVLIRAGLECDFEWVNENIEKPVAILAYEQNEFGALAWVAEIVHETPKGRLVIKMPLIKSGDNYIIGSVYSELPKETEISLSVSRE